MRSPRGTSNQTLMACERGPRDRTYEEVRGLGGDEAASGNGPSIRGGEMLQGNLSHAGVLGNGEATRQKGILLPKCLLEGDPRTKT